MDSTTVIELKSPLYGALQLVGTIESYLNSYKWDSTRLACQPGLIRATSYQSGSVDP